MKNGNKKAIMIGTIILAVLAVLFVVIYTFNRPSSAAGSKNITLEVTGSKGDTTEYSLSTDAEFLKQAMDELSANGSGFTYSGVGGDYGLMIETVNGERAVFDKDGAYWALYVNGEYGQFGADSQPVTDGDRYTWKYELSQ